MSVLPDDLRRQFSFLFNQPAPVTDLELALKNSYWMNDPSRRSQKLLNDLKSKAFQRRQVEFKSIDDFEFDLIPTSFDNVFGGPLTRGEVVSVEGVNGSGKTRLLLKIAHEIAVVGNVLYIDADFALQENIFRSIKESLNITEPEASFDIESDLPLIIAVVAGILDLYPTINFFCNCRSPDLIVIDGLMSLFQSVTSVDGPGSAMLQELALELKTLARERKCVIIVTNVLRTDTNPPNQPFLGRVYGSLWHTRVQMTPSGPLAKCEIVQSPRSPHKTTTISIESLEQYPDETV